MSPLLIEVLMPSQSFPRVSGDEPLNAVAGGNADTFSPRERG